MSQLGTLLESLLENAMTKKATLNGSANLFAKATEAMFNDALNASRQELKEDLQAMADRLNARSDERIDTTN